MSPFEIDWDRVKQVLTWIAGAEHNGDIYEDLVCLSKALGLPEPFWCEGYSQAYFPWVDVSDYEDDDEEYDCGEEECPIHGRLQ